MNHTLEVLNNLSALIALLITFIIGWKLGDVFTEERRNNKWDD